MKTILAIFLILPLMLAAMAIPNANALVTKNLYADGPDTAWGLDVGDVEISTVGTDIQIVVTVTGDWNITEVHCDIGDGTTLAGIPTTGSGNPKVGKFDCNKDYAAGSEPTTVTCTIPLGTLSGTIAVACQVSVQLDESALPVTDPALKKYNSTDGVAIPETAWAAHDITGTPGDDGVGNNQFVASKSWATYITYTVGA